MSNEKALAAISRYFARLADDPAHQYDHVRGSGAEPELAAKLRDYYGLPYVLLLPNATTALLAIARALGLEDTEVIAPAFSYGATVAFCIPLHNRVCFADVDPVTLCIDPDSARRAVTSRTRALFGVDMFGVPCDMYALRAVADEHGLWLVIDAAASLGARIRGEPAGRAAEVVVTSFGPGKPVFGGEGSAMLTASEDVYQKLVWATQHPTRQVRELGRYADNEFGLNGRQHPLATEWINAIFEDSLAEVTVHRERSLTALDAAEASGLVVPAQLRERELEPSFFRLSAAWKRRPAARSLRDALARQGLSFEVVSSHLRPLYAHPAFRAQHADWGLAPGGCPEAEAQARKRFVLAAQVDGEGGADGRTRGPKSAPITVGRALLATPLD